MAPVRLKDVPYIAIDSIIVNRDARQRREIDIERDGFAAAIKREGVVVPLLCSRSSGRIELVYGERRLTAAKAAGFTDVPVSFVEDMSADQLQLIELKENLDRAELPWRDAVRSVAKLHNLYQQRAVAEGADEWTAMDTARALSRSNQVNEMLAVAEYLDDPRFARCATVREAYNIVQRFAKRAEADMLNDLAEVGAAVFGTIAAAGPAASGSGEGNENPPVVSAHGAENNASTGTQIRPETAPLGKTASPPITAPAPAPESILVADFKSWVVDYSGPKFNFVHCDFPYGRNVFDGPQSGRDSWLAGSGTAVTEQPYDDAPDVYWELIEVFCKNLDRFMHPSAHLMFWLDAEPKVMWETVERFRALAPSLVFLPKPLIWVKSDNVGVLSDPKRRARHIYEAALVASREDRLIVKAVSDAYSAPTDKAHHPSTKPEPVLRHFMQMFVDENTKMLDPTCGSGSALRAAESLGARYVLGLERDSTWADNARSALRTFRGLRKVTAGSSQ